VGALLYRGHPEVVDADLADLLRKHGPRMPKLLSRYARIVDRRVMHLIKMCWMRRGRNRDRGRKTRTDRGPGTTGPRHSARFTPSHHCWRIFNAGWLGWKMLGLERKFSHAS